jgi:diguanylate cyclase (GGDEF)-like protein/PAS domain S-box-containing protein
MYNSSITIKIISIFAIPTLAMAYFSYSFVATKYSKLQESEKSIQSSKISEKISKLIHNIQIERGLSAGYLVTKDRDSTIIKELTKQHKNTDKTFQAIIDIVNSNTQNRVLLKDVFSKNEPLLKDIIYKFSEISHFRKRVIDKKISFDEEIEYYTQINRKLMNSIKSFAIVLQNNTKDHLSLSILQNLKEYAGLERAYTYKYLLSKKRSLEDLKKILFFQDLQQKEHEDFMRNASIESALIFSEILKEDTLINIKSYRDRVAKGKLTSADADGWFLCSTKRINILEDISTKMLENYSLKAQKIHEHAISALYITVIFWILSLLSLLLLAYLLRKLLKKEEFHTQELRIAAYTFDSHEAMAITDVNGVIIKVNNAFTRITGYMPDEVIGKNPRVLKSLKHSDKFYKEMWRTIHTEGVWSDEIYNKRKNGDIYQEHLSITAIKDENNITTHYIAQFLDISEMKKAQAIATHQANHDDLTDLANRKYLTKRLNEEFLKAKRHDFLHAFLFIDIDNFKKVNDTYGHNIGDLLIKEIANRLKNSVREEDIVARLGGDEFAIMLLNLNHKENDINISKAVKEVATKILEKLREPFYLEEHQLNITLSIGIKLFPESEKNVQDVLIHADTAMYQAKNQGKNKFLFFNKSTELELKQLALLEEEIQEGFSNNQFELYYQPKVEISTGKIAGAELLIRWNHPTKGLLYPNAFIKTITNMGLVHRITHEALHCACSFIQKNGKLFHGTLAINVNSHELLDTNFEDEIINIISSYNISADRIELEILEDELIKDFSIVVEKIKKLQSFGINFSIDDFGTGYSSIKYLKQLPLDTLKIDRDFLLNSVEETGKDLVKIIINMAQIFNINTVVEGVESNAQLEFIKENGAKYYQGFLFSRAIEKKLFVKMLEKESL